LRHTDATTSDAADKNERDAHPAGNALLADSVDETGRFGELFNRHECRACISEQRQKRDSLLSSIAKNSMVVSAMILSSKSKNCCPTR
jgi:hypothetical protein